MPGHLARRQDIYDRNPRGNRTREGQLGGVLDVLQQCMTGNRPSQEVMLGSMNTLLGMINDEYRKRRANTLGPQQPVDVQDPRANRLLGNDTLPETAAPTREAEYGMTRIMDDMGVPEEARQFAPQVLNNLVDNGDGTFSSADGSLKMDNREQMMYMVQRTLQAIGEELARRGGHGVADVGPDLRTRLTMRDQNGRRTAITVDPRNVIEGEVVNG